MKIIDIVDEYGGVGCLKRYYVEKGIDDYNIYSFNLELSFGDIKNNRRAFLEELYEIDFDYEELLKKLESEISDDVVLRIWSSKRNDNAYLLLLFICDRLKNKIDKMKVVFVSDYNDYICNVGSLDYKEIEEILKYEQEINKNKILEYATLWDELKSINSELRVLENGIVKNKRYADYYEDILNVLEEKGECTIANLVGECMARHLINDGLTIYSYIIDRLISLEKIKINKKSEKHFNYVIKIGE